ncbi:sulfotransferase family protein [Streptomyces sp. KLMMK]|uniref:sulfotransferase family protein n=1 Tax=Streptomyces sp. KLMMK TaxID=3109353 RepID=UPI00300B066B
MTPDRAVRPGSAPRPGTVPHPGAVPRLGPPAPAPRPKIFGIGLSRTGTRSLTAALRTLGFDVAHYPADPGTYAALLAGTARFPLLDHRDGITDITVVPYYQDLDRAWPGAKFILTVREEEGWLASCRTHWKPAVDGKAGRSEVYPQLQRFLRAAVYASHAFDPERFRTVARRHTAEVLRHFAGRPGDLLVLDITAGQGYERLAPFLGVPVPDGPFPHTNAYARVPAQAPAADGTPGPAAPAGGAR